MLTHAQNCLISDDTNASVVLEAAHLGSYEALRNFLYRGLRASYPPITPAMRAVIKAWYLTIIKPNLTSGHWSPHTPLCFNPNLTKFQSLPDLCLWAAKGIKYLVDVCDGDVLFT